MIGEIVVLQGIWQQSLSQLAEEEANRSQAEMSFREYEYLSPASQAPIFFGYRSPRSASLRVGLLFCPAAWQPRARPSASTAPEEAALNSRTPRYRAGKRKRLCNRRHLWILFASCPTHS